eukprot:817798-Pelagomonas_calceolata.AAC.4
MVCYSVHIGRYQEISGNKASTWAQQDQVEGQDCRWRRFWFQRAESVHPPTLMAFLALISLSHTVAGPCALLLC